MKVLLHSTRKRMLQGNKKILIIDKEVGLTIMASITSYCHEVSLRENTN